MIRYPCTFIHSVKNDYLVGLWSSAMFWFCCLSFTGIWKMEEQIAYPVSNTRLVLVSLKVHEVLLAMVFWCWSWSCHSPWWPLIPPLHRCSYVVYWKQAADALIVTAKSQRHVISSGSFHLGDEFIPNRVCTVALVYVGLLSITIYGLGNPSAGINWHCQGDSESSVVGRVVGSLWFFSSSSLRAL